MRELHVYRIRAVPMTGPEPPLHYLTVANDERHATIAEPAIAHFGKGVKVEVVQDLGRVEALSIEGVLAGS